MNSYCYNFCHTCELECTACFGIVTYVYRVVLVSLYFVNVRSYWWCSQEILPAHLTSYILPMKFYCMVMVFYFKLICVWCFSTVEVVCYKVKVNVFKWWHSNANAFVIQLHSCKVACLAFLPLPCVGCLLFFYKRSAPWFPAQIQWRIFLFHAL